MNAWRLFSGATLVTGAVLTLGACAEKPQAIASGKLAAADTKASEGSTQGMFAAPGWKAGDQTAWEAQIRTRTQNGQNDYTRTTSK